MAQTLIFSTLSGKAVYSDSALISLLIPNNRENTPPANDQLRLKGKYHECKGWYEVLVKRGSYKSLNLRRNSTAYANYVNDENMVAERQSAILKSTRALSILFLSIFIDVKWAF